MHVNENKTEPFYLGIWLKRQRTAQKNGKLHPLHLQLLQDLVVLNKLRWTNASTTNGSIRINADGSISSGNVNSSISVPPTAPVSKMSPPTISTLPSATANKTAMDVA